VTILDLGRVLSGDDKLHAGEGSSFTGVNMLNTSVEPPDSSLSSREAFPVASYHPYIWRTLLPLLQRRSLGHLFPQY
ncbi:MAG: hypothetical protein NTY51_08485, partial [Deltaproteobacteria bacterium]|nr:hypothetical protein [Deltaproteobacteria bacterium]